MSPDAREWMSANGMDESDMDRAVSWSLLLSLPLAAAIVVIGLLAFPRMLPFFLVAAAMVFVVLRQYALGIPRAMMVEEGRRFAAEAPEVIGSLSISVSLNPSLEDAVRPHGEGVLRRRLAGLQWDVVMGKSPDLQTAISRMASMMTDECRSLHQSLYLVLGATRERTVSGRKRLLDKANTLVIEGMRERVVRYAASLQLPAMAIFCLGIILPILLFTVVPMTSMDLKGGRTSSAVQFLGCVLLLAAVPLATLVIARGLVKKNPLQCRPAPVRCPPRAVSLLAASFALGVFLCLIPGARVLFPLLLCLPPALAVVCILRKRISAGRAEQGGETELALLLYEMGNLLESGSGPEQALTLALSSRPSSPTLDRVRLCLSLQISGLGGLSSGLKEDALLLRSAPLSNQALVAVLAACEKDPQAAGAMALDLAQYLSELQKAKEGMRVQLRSIMDMMTFTAVIFAPLVIGLTTSIFAAISATGQVGGGLQDADLIGGVYVLELCLISAYMTTFIAGDGKWVSWAWRSALSCPISALVLISASALSSSLTVR
jgi:hypothetical protein